MPYSSGCSRVWTPPPTAMDLSSSTRTAQGYSAASAAFLAFNAGGCCPPATWNNADDVGFTDAILSVLEEKVPVDVGRIYATGMSNGGMMAHRMAVESPRIAAVASVAGQLAVTCRPSRPVSVMEFHSEDDPIALYEGRKARHTRRPPCPNPLPLGSGRNRPVGGAQ